MVFLGIEATGGISTHDEVEAQTDHYLMRTTGRVIVLTDGSKIGKRAFSRIAEISEVHTLITDTGADPAELDRLRATGIEILTV